MKKQNGYNKKKEGLRKSASFFFSPVSTHSPDTKYGVPTAHIYVRTRARTYGERKFLSVLLRFAGWDSAGDS